MAFPTPVIELSDDELPVKPRPAACKPPTAPTEPPATQATPLPPAVQATLLPPATQAIPSESPSSGSPSSRTDGGTPSGPEPQPPAPSSARRASKAPTLIIPRSSAPKPASLWTVPRYDPASDPSSGNDVKGAANTQPAITVTAPTSMPNPDVAPDSVPTEAPPSRKRRSGTRGWSGRLYADFMQSLQESFDFDDFAERHGRTRKDVFDKFSALVNFPLADASKRGNQRLKEAKKAGDERTQTFEEAVKTLERIHKDEVKAASAKSCTCGCACGGKGTSGASSSTAPPPAKKRRTAAKAPASTPPAASMTPPSSLPPTVPSGLGAPTAVMSRKRKAEQNPLPSQSPPALAATPTSDPYGYGRSFFNYNSSNFNGLSSFNNPSPHAQQPSYLPGKDHDESRILPSSGRFKGSEEQRLEKMYGMPPRPGASQRDQNAGQTVGGRAREVGAMQQQATKGMRAMFGSRNAGGVENHNTKCAGGINDNAHAREGNGSERRDFDNGTYNGRSAVPEHHKNGISAGRFGSNNHLQAPQTNGMETGGVNDAQSLETTRMHFSSASLDESQQKGTN